MMFGFTLATYIWDWYGSGNNLHGTPHGSQKKPNAGRQSTGHLSTDVLCHGLEKNGMVGAWHGHGMPSVNLTWPYCVNQMRKTHSKPIVAQHSRGMAWAQQATCESAFNEQTWLLFSLVLHLLQRIGSTQYLCTVTCVTYLAADKTAVRRLRGIYQLWQLEGNRMWYMWFQSYTTDPTIPQS